MYLTVYISLYICIYGGKGQITQEFIHQTLEIMLDTGLYSTKLYTVPVLEESLTKREKRHVNK